MKELAMLRRNFFSFIPACFGFLFIKNEVQAENSITITRLGDEKYYSKNGFVFLIENDFVKRWYNQKGELHRENDLPAVEYKNGEKSWWLNNRMQKISWEDFGKREITKRKDYEKNIDN